MKRDICFGSNPELEFVGHTAPDFSSFGIDPGHLAGDKSVFSDWSKGVCLSINEVVKGDIKRFFDAVMAPEPVEPFDPWADTLRLNELGRAPNRQRDIAEFECRLVMRGTPLVVTTAQAKELEAIEFDQALYRATDNPFNVIVVGGGGRHGIGHLPLSAFAGRQFVVPKTGSQDRLRNRWGQLK